MPLSISELSVYDSNNSASNGDPILVMSFPVANETFLRQLRTANQQIYNTFAVFVVVGGQNDIKSSAILLFDRFSNL